MNKWILLFLFLSPNLWSSEIMSMFPETRLGSSEKNNQNPEMTEKVFNHIINKIEKIYSPEIESQGAKLVIKKKWKSRTVNAYAYQKEQNWYIKLFGGMAREKAITADGFALVVCHELGHHMGGAPKKLGSDKWSSPEGQSDYWGASKCLKRFFADEDNAKALSGRDIDPEITSRCQEFHKTENDIAICQRVALAGLSLASLFNIASPQDPYPKELSFTDQDPMVVDQTSFDHPKAQCRLDTFFEAALCTKDPKEKVDNADPTIGTCNRQAGDSRGFRPLCWYRP